MGGMNEQLAPPPVGSKSQKSSIRIHENNGEIHFHDDNAGLKAAIDKKQMLKAYQDADSSGWVNPIVLVSKKKDTTISIRRHEILDPNTGHIKEFDLEFVVSPIKNSGSNFSSLRKALGI